MRIEKQKIVRWGMVGALAFAVFLCSKSAIGSGRGQDGRSDTSFGVSETSHDASTSDSSTTPVPMPSSEDDITVTEVRARPEDLHQGAAFGEQPVSEGAPTESAPGYGRFESAQGAEEVDQPLRSAEDQALRDLAASEQELIAKAGGGADTGAAYPDAGGTPVSEVTQLAKGNFIPTSDASVGVSLPRMHATTPQPAGNVQPVAVPQPVNSAELEQLRAQNKLLIEQQGKLVDKIIEYRRELKDQKGKLDALDESATDREKKLALQLDRVQSNFLVAKEQLDRLRAEEGELRRAMIERDKLKGELERAKLAIFDLDKSVKQGQAAIRETGELRTQKAALEAKLLERASDASEMAKLRGRHEAVLQDLSSAQLRVKNLEKTIGELRLSNEQNAGAYRAATEKQNGESEQLKAGLDRALVRLQSLNEKRSEAEKRAAENEAALKLATETRDRYATELELLKGRAKSRDTELNDMKRELARVSEDARSSGQSVLALTEKLNTASKLAANAEQCRTDLQVSNAKLVEKEGLEQRFAQASAELARVQNKLLIYDAEAQAGLKTPRQRLAPPPVARTPSAAEPQKLQAPEVTQVRLPSNPLQPAVVAESGVMLIEIKQPKVTLRAGPAMENSPVMEVQQGAQLIVEARQGDWYRVTAPTGKSAYVRADLVRALPQAPAVPKAPAAAPVSPFENPQGMVPFDVDSSVVPPTSAATPDSIGRPLGRQTGDEFAVMNQLKRNFSAKPARGGE